MIDQIRSIGEIIAVKLFGKSYMQLRYESGMDRGSVNSLRHSELFECCQIAGEIRMEVISQVRRLGRDPTQLSMEDLLGLCDVVISQDMIQRQKAELRRRGFLSAANTEESTVTVE